MITYPITAAKPKVKLGAYQISNDRRPAATGGNVSVKAQWQHCALLVYAVPHERVVGLAPSSFQVETSLVNGRAVAWVSVASWLDQGARCDGRGEFEQTSYRLHVRRDGAPAHWLLGASLGSLAAVATRNWWSAPWHLGAMEFQVAYDQRRARYRRYHLRTQSQRINAQWQLTDSGQPLEESALPATLRHSVVSDYFLRRDGLVGWQRAHLLNSAFTRGQVQMAHCDLLEEMKLVRGDEFMHPQLVALQHSLACKLEAPTVSSAIRTAPAQLAA